MREYHLDSSRLERLELDILIKLVELVFQSFSSELTSNALCNSSDLRLVIESVC